MLFRFETLTRPSEAARNIRPDEPGRRQNYRRFFPSMRRSRTAPPSFFSGARGAPHKIDPRERQVAPPFGRHRSPYETARFP